jgi:hypothetical protein
MRLRSLGQAGGILILWLSAIEFGGVKDSVDPIGSSSSEMPRAWRRRLVQTGPTEGEEVALSRKCEEAGFWLVATSRDGIRQIQVSDRRYVRTTGHGPKPGVQHRPFPVLSEQEKNVAMVQAGQISATGTSGVQMSEQWQFVLALHGSIEEDRRDAAGGPVRVAEPQSERVRERTKDKEEESKASPRGHPTGEMSVLIKKLQKQTRTPQEIYVVALEAFEEEDKETWAGHFPPGYRERVGPQFLGKVHSKGKTAKEWAKEWVKEKGLRECDETRAIIPACASLDATLLVDQVPGAINQVSIEKISRKVRAVKSAHKEIKKEADWKRPVGSKVWNSRVDLELTKQIDPHVEDVDHVFINRRAEDELKTEMNRDAAMVKAKAKLAERS